MSPTRSSGTMPHEPSAAILGCGVSGLTTAIILGLAGYETTIYAEHLPTWCSYERNLPSFASLYAAASVLPHGVTIDDTVRHLERSEAFFERLRHMEGFTVRLQRHYELFERVPPQRPGYLSTARNLSMVSPANGDMTRTPDVPVRGWSYDTYVVDMPSYMEELLAFYRQAGGTVVERSLSRDAFLALEEDVLVNCGGLRGRELVDDPAPYEITRGHLVYVDVPASAAPERWTAFSYNYMPTSDVYSQPNGAAADVYFYPRSDRWVLGGSRQVVETSDRPERIAAEYPSTISIDDIDVPRPVIDLNRELLLQMTGVDITDYPMQAAFGYRYERHPVRLEPSLEDERIVVHNYGHGGAGLTLSWSCAVEVLEISERLNV